MAAAERGGDETGRGGRCDAGHGHAGHGHVGHGHAGAGANVAAPVILVAKVEHEVGHRRPHADVAVDFDGLGRIDEGRAERQLVDRSALVAELGFRAEHAEIVTRDQVEVDAGLVVDDRAVFIVVAVIFNIEFGVGDEHRAAFDTDIPRLVASDRRGRQRRRSERHRNGQLAHKYPLSHES